MKQQENMYQQEITIEELAAMAAENALSPLSLKVLKLKMYGRTMGQIAKLKCMKEPFVWKLYSDAWNTLCRRRERLIREREEEKKKLKIQKKNKL